ncbi:protein-glutamate O-methyltransferase CheR [Thalassolituus sp. C2-1]|nr:protein-glutamate O-methyltransferase CheR [Thalassolituus sp. C2-1]
MTTSTLRSSNYTALQPLADTEFNFFRQWLFQNSGITLNDSKKSLVSGRLSKRIAKLGLGSFSAYLKIIRSGDKEEAQVLLNILTTNETYFFREHKHFEFMQSVILPDLKQAGKVSVWSAAASTGEEAYTVALIMADAFGLHGPWSVTGTDINTEVLSIGQRAIYPIEASVKIPESYRKKYCLKGKGKDQGLFRICGELRKQVNFTQHNLMQPYAGTERFNLVFLRNVLIYFDLEEKKEILRHVMNSMTPGGWLLVGHSESITGYSERIKQYQPGCYRLIS